MGLSVSLIGLDSEIYEFISGTLEKAFLVIGCQNVEAKTFALGEAGLNDFREDIGSYRVLHHLRVYAAHIEFEGYPPKKPLKDITDCSIIEQIYKGSISTNRFQHLINHSDHGGYYLPIDFHPPILLDERSLTYGTDGPIGSCQQLLLELEEINKYLKLPGDYGQLGSERFWDIVSEDEWSSEKWAWGILHWLAGESISHRLILAFG